MSLALTTIVHSLSAASTNSTSPFGNYRVNGYYGVKIYVHNHICEALVYSGFKVTPMGQECNADHQETWDEPETINPTHTGYIEFQGVPNVGVEGVVQWNIAGDPEKSVQVYYRASQGVRNGPNGVMVTGDSMHFDNTDNDMLPFWFDDDCCTDECCTPAKGLIPGNHGWCYNQGAAYPGVNKKKWTLDNIENTNYRVTGYIDHWNNPHLDVYVEDRDGTGAICPRMYALSSHVPFERK